MKSSSQSIVLLLGLISAFKPGVALSDGHESGNGGDVMVCRNPDHSIARIELLDYYEALELRGIQYDLGPSSMDYPSKLSLAISRLGKLSPLRAKMYQDQANSFMSEANLLPGIVLNPVTDTGDLALPAGCGIEQIAVQRAPEFPEDKRYTISKDLWDALDNDSKAGLLLHEIIYREAIGYGQDTSVAVRYFNSYVSSHKIDPPYTEQEFLGLMQEIAFPESDVQELEIVPASAAFFTGGEVQSAIVDETGQVVRGYQFDAEVCPNSKITFLDSSASGEIESFVPLSEQPFKIQGLSLNIAQFCRAHLYSDGHVKSFYLKDAASLQFQNGEVRSILANSLVALDENGNVIGFTAQNASTNCDL